MGMGSIPAKATIIKESFIQSLPKSGPILIRLRDFMEDNDVDEACLDTDNGDMWSDNLDGETWKSFTSTVFDLQKSFYVETGLHIYPFYYSSEDGDRYDDLPDEGAYWAVDGVYQLTPAGEKVKDHIEDVMWTVYG